MKTLALLAAAVAGLVPVATVSAADTAPATGRLLVLLDSPVGGAVASAARTRAVIASAGARRSGHSAPQIGLVTVRPRAGESLSELAQRLRADPHVASVELERRSTPREVPNDPALVESEAAAGTPPGAVAQWWAARQFLPEAWDLSHGEGALVAVIDQGIDGGHPEFAGRIRDSIDLDDDPGSGPPLTDQNGHGTHVSSMACAAAGNGIGIAGAGYGCSLLVVKSDLTDSSVASGIVQAADRGAHAINMSFGQDGRTREAVPIAQKRAIQYAFERDVVLVAAASDQPVTEQGDPANVLQPTGTGPQLGSGLGLSVTAADFDDRRASFAGFGTQISMAAYGTFRYRPAVPSGPPGLLGAFPATPSDIEAECKCRTTFQGDPRFAYLQGTSMAAPMVAAVAAMMRVANRDLRAREVIRLLEQTATRPAGTGWNQELGWGILNAGDALAAAKGVDRTRPVSRLMAPSRVSGSRDFVLRWSGRDPTLAGVVATGIARFEVWRSFDGKPAKRIAVTTKRRLVLRGTPVHTYAFFTRAVDNAGNRERRPARPDARTRVVRP